jgi:DNA replication protein DnaC
MVKKIKNKILRNANIDPLYQGCSFKNFDETVLSRENLKPYNKLKKYAEEIGTAMELPQSVYLLSKYPGIGKTHLTIATLKLAAKRIAEQEYKDNEVVKYGVNPRTTTWAPLYFINVSEGLLDIKNDYSENGIDFKQSKIFKNVKHARFLVLDDIFNETRYSPFVLETLFYWVDYRLKNNLATVFTSNNNFEIFLKDETSPVKDDKLKTIARNTASRVGKMVKNYKLFFESSPKTDYRQS